MTAALALTVAASRRVGQGSATLRLVAASVVLAVGLAAAGCGSEKTFTAEELTQQVKQQGVSIRLGRQLPGGGGADRVYAINLPRLPGQPAPPPDEEGGRGPNGTLYVYGDAGGAGDKLDACRAAGGLLCFRASNIVIVMDQEAAGIEAGRLGLAIRRLASE
jgi:hypothetical protein